MVRRLSSARSFFLLGILLSVMLVAAACGGFGGEPADQGGGDGGDTGNGSGGGSQEGPELSPPPEIEGDVVSEGDEHTIKFGIGLAETSPQYKSVEYFGQILDQRTDGRIQVDIFPNSQVGDDNEMMDGLQSGSLEMTYPSTSPAATLVPELAVFDLPFLFPSRESAYAVMDSDLGQEMLDSFEGTGIKALYFSENGFRQLTNSQRAIESAEDISGLKLRVMENDVQVDVWNALGANPTPMAFGEVFSAMEQGVVDGQENPWSTILTSNFFEVQQYGAETRHVYTPFIIMISQGFWDGLSAEDQQIVQEAAQQSGDYERVISEEYDEYSKAQLEEQGMEITEYDEQQMAEFQDATQPVYDEWAPQIGEDLVQEIQSMVEEVEGQ